MGSSSVERKLPGLHNHRVHDDVAPDVHGVPADGAAANHSPWKRRMAELLAGVSLFSATLLPLAAPTHAMAMTGGASPQNNAVHMQTIAYKRLLPTTATLVAPGERHTVSAGDALSLIVAAYRMADGSKVPWHAVRALNESVFKRDSTGSKLRVGDVITLPYGAMRIAEPQKLPHSSKQDGGATEVTPAFVSAPIKATVKVEASPPQKAAVPTAITAAVEPFAKVPAADAAPVVQPRATPASDALFQMDVFRSGREIPVEGTFKAKRLGRMWTIHFDGTAKVLSADASKLSLQVNATGKNGLFADQTRSVVMTWTRVGDGPDVRFVGKEAGEGDGEEGRLTRVSSSKTETVLRGQEGGTVTFRQAGDVITLNYEQNVIRFKLSP